jgi:hypothetical protein
MTPELDHTGADDYVVTGPAVSEIEQLSQIRAELSGLAEKSRTVKLSPEEEARYGELFGRKLRLLGDSLQ